jgi:chromosome segregation protein
LFRLKRLELLGFKSFADRTRLEFGEGTVGIVGPNGCGKSNLADAINWVLGEQSARLLRGERMADVIFSGTGTRLPTGMAEVNITLEDPEFAHMDGAFEEAHEPDEALLETAEAGGNGNGGSGKRDAVTLQERLRNQAGQITVARRLFRSGESEYLINGELCRLREIQDIFMGTGLGPESYAIIEQGRIGQILSSKPSDRRMILEEAAGISKFKTRKRAAELKLESSRQNLSRITDILEEVTKQVNSLKRQASKARRFRELQEQLTGRMRITLASRLKALGADCDRLRGEIAALGAQCEEASRQLDGLERGQKTAVARGEELESQLTELRDAAARADLEKQRLESQIEQMRQQALSLAARASDAEAETRRLSQHVQSLEAEAAETARRRKTLEAERLAADEETRRLAASHDELGGRIHVSEQAIEASRAALLEAVGMAAALRNQITQLGESEVAMERQRAKLESERTASETERQKFAAELNQIISENQSREGELSSLAEALARASSQLDHAQQAEVAARSSLDALRQEHSGAWARKQALEESLAHHAYSTESVRRLLTGEIGSNGHRFRPLGVLADFLEVSAGYEEVVEEFLDAQLDCVVVEEHEQARSGIAMLRQEGAGRSTFFVTRLPGDGHASNGNGHGAELSQSREPGVLAAVGELVRFAPRLGLNGDLPLPSLNKAYVVEDNAAAERLAAVYPDCHFLTRTGEHYHHRLVSGGRGKNAGPLAQRRDFRELEHRTLELSQNLSKAERTLIEAGSAAAALKEEQHRLTGLKIEAEKTLVLTNEKVRQTREALDRAEERLRVLESETAALGNERAALEAQRMELRAALERVTAEKSRQEELSNLRAAEVRELRAEFDRTAQELARAQSAASALEERARTLESESARLENEIRQGKERTAELGSQIESWQAGQRRLANEIEAGKERSAVFESEQQAARERVRALAEEVQTVRALRDDYGPRVDEARSRFEEHRTRRSEAEVALARAESDRDHHAAQSREVLHDEPEALLQALAPEAMLEGEALTTAETEVRELKTRIENLGPLNMMALEELQEAEERYTFLETQRQDLLTSIEETAEAIREIDRVSRQQFLEAFKAINLNFAETFRTLFGGGIGQMRLADENDPDSGLDIVAQPPGKRLQNVLLLSGGEKALAALALLIAIFRYAPSPFCVLDEVDAPLDESNVDRFTRLIRDMGRHTQFILITHNKRTMETARALYGVTMEEPGVSKLVSVKFEEAMEEPLAVPA